MPSLPRNCAPNQYEDDLSDCHPCSEICKPDGERWMKRNCQKGCPDVYVEMYENGMNSKTSDRVPLAVGLCFGFGILFVTVVVIVAVVLKKNKKYRRPTEQGNEPVMWNHTSGVALRMQQQAASEHNVDPENAAASLNMGSLVSDAGIDNSEMESVPTHTTANSEVRYPIPCSVAADSEVDTAVAQQVESLITVSVSQQEVRPAVHPSDAVREDSALFEQIEEGDLTPRSSEEDFSGSESCNSIRTEELGIAIINSE